MEILRIDWGTGHMDLRIREFFPCSLRVAGKVTRLISRHCTEEDRAALLAELRDMVGFYQARIQVESDSVEESRRRYAAQGFMEKAEFEAMKHGEIEIRKNETLLKRAKKNIELIERRLS